MNDEKKPKRTTKQRKPKKGIKPNGKTPDHQNRIQGDDRIKIARWIVQNSIRLYGLGYSLPATAKLASSAEEAGIEVKPATLSRTSRYLKAIGAIPFKLTKRKTIRGPIKLSRKAWHKIDVYLRAFAPRIMVEDWTVAAVQRKIATECKIKAHEQAITNALGIMGFVPSGASTRGVLIPKEPKAPEGEE